MSQPRSSAPVTNLRRAAVEDARASCWWPGYPLTYLPTYLPPHGGPVTFYLPAFDVSVYGTELLRSKKNQTLACEMSRTSRAKSESALSTSRAQPLPPAALLRSLFHQPRCCAAARLVEEAAQQRGWWKRLRSAGGKCRLGFRTRRTAHFAGQRLVLFRPK